MELPPGTIVLEGHREKRIHCVISLPDGDRVVTSSSDKSIRIYSAASGDRLRTIVIYDVAAFCLASLGGNIVASGDLKGNLRVWDVSTGWCVYAAHAGEQVRDLAPLGLNRLVAASGSNLLYFSYRGGQGFRKVHEVKDAHPGLIMCVEACDGLVASTAYDNDAALWNAHTYARVAVPYELTHHVIRIVMDSENIVTTSRDSRVRVYDAKSFCFIRTLDSAYPSMMRPFPLLGDGHILSCSACHFLSDSNTDLRVTSMSTGEDVVHLNFDLAVVSGCVTQGGWILAAVREGDPFLFPPPLAVARIGAFRVRLAAARHRSRAAIIRIAGAGANAGSQV
jgi:WD40 repeat protein